MNQAQLDAENFMNTELQKREDISKHFVSLRDYDMQYIEVKFLGERSLFWLHEKNHLFHGKLYFWALTYVI